MNCRDLEKIMPELIEGELDERTARLAEEHIASCPACAAERRAYAEALGALAQPRPMLEVPAELDALELPERRQGWAWLRPALGTAALAAVMAGIMLMPQRVQEPVTPKPPVRHESPAPVKTGKTSEPTYSLKAAVTEPAVQQPKVRSRPTRTATVAAVPQTGKVGQSATLRGDRTITRSFAVTASEPPNRPAEETARVRITPNHEESLSLKTKLGYPVSHGLPEKSVVVVACDIQDEPENWFLDYQGRPEAKAPSEPSVVHIESTDTSTGSTTIYDYSRDEQGSEQVIEIQSRT